MCKELKSHCPVCNKTLDENEDLVTLGKGMNTRKMCEECYEIDDTPISNECDYCSSPTTTNFNGTDLCEDCAEQWHSGKKDKIGKYYLEQFY